jgi:hypothetical protein
MRLPVSVALAALALAGCVTHPSSFPANEQARTLGNLRVDMTIYGVGAGPVTVHMPDGETLVGRYSVNVGGVVGFGSVYGAAYGNGGYASGSAFGSSSMIAMSSPGIADATGPKTTIHCEVMNNNYTGHGNGACQTDKGALYRIQY